MPVRFLIAAFLIILGGALSVPAAISIWQEREIQDEDNFVSTTMEVFEDDEVQVLLATRLTDTIMTRTDLQARITDGLQSLEEERNAPPATSLLAGPLTRLVRETVYRLCVDALQSNALSEILDTALRATHRAVTAVINDDSSVLEESNGQVVLNLRPIILRVVEDLAGERGTEALSKLDIPEDAGIIVIREKAQNPWIWKVAGWVDDFDPVVPIITAIVFLLAIAVAKNRRRAVIATGATLAIVAGLTLVALGAPVKELATSWPKTDEGQQAAKNAYDIILDSFRQQQFFTVIFGLGLVVVASAAGDKRFTSWLRRTVGRGDADEDAGFVGFVKERAGGLRLAGFAIAGVVLILWPDPSLRTLITVGFLLGTYLTLIWILASDSDTAETSRATAKRWIGGAGGEAGEPSPGVPGWIVRNAGALRVAGVVVAVGFVLFVWDLALGGFVLIVAGTLLYLAIIEWAVASARENSKAGGEA